MHKFSSFVYKSSIHHLLSSFYRDRMNTLLTPICHISLMKLPLVILCRSKNYVGPMTNQNYCQGC